MMIFRRLPYISLVFGLICLVGCNKKRHRKAKPSGKAPQALVVHKQEEPPKPKKPIKQMSVEEAVEAAHYYEFIDHEALLLATYQHIIAKSKDSDITACYLLKAADHYLQTNNFSEAKRYYKKLTTLYPGYKDIERASYREVLAHFLSSLAPSRDQAATQATITLAKKYLADFPQGAAGQVISILGAAYKRLLLSELLVIEFYLNKFSLTGTPQPLKGGIQRMKSLQTAVIAPLKKYDQNVAKMTESREWKEQVERPWSTFDELVETSIGCQQVVQHLERAVALLETMATNPDKLVHEAALVVIARDKF
jgi:tetratricopeptide (TPR) repeat protein